MKRFITSLPLDTLAVRRLAQTETVGHTFEARGLTEVNRRLAALFAEEDDAGVHHYCEQLTEVGDPIDIAEQNLAQRRSLVHFQKHYSIVVQLEPSGVNDIVSKQMQPALVERWRTVAKAFIERVYKVMVCGHLT